MGCWCPSLTRLLRGFEQLDNPLRLNNLATGLRELIRLVLRDLAPDNKIKACGWYEEEKDKNGNTIITRPQRIRYAAQAGLPTDFVQNTMGIDVAKTIADFSALIKLESPRVPPISAQIGFLRVQVLVFAT